MWITLFLGLATGGAIGFLIARTTARRHTPSTLPTLTEEDKQKIREFRRFLSYDGFPDE